MVNFVTTSDEALWDRDNGLMYAIRRNGTEMSTGVKRPIGAEPVWLPIIKAYPEDRIPGHPSLLGPSTFELDPAYNPNAVLETYPEADFSPEAFLRAAEDRAHNQATGTLHATDWFVIRQLELGTPIPPAIATARQAVRDAVTDDLERLAGLVPAEYLDFTPTATTAASRAHDKALAEYRDARRMGVPEPAL